MVIGLLLIVLGLLGPLASWQWHRHRWLHLARPILEATSIHFLGAVPMVGLLVSTTGLSILWPPAILLVMLAGAGFLWAMASSAKRAQARETGGGTVSVSPATRPAPAATAAPGPETRVRRVLRPKLSARPRPGSRTGLERPAEPARRPQRSA